MNLASYTRLRAPAPQADSPETAAKVVLAPAFEVVSKDSLPYEAWIPQSIYEELKRYILTPLNAKYKDISNGVVRGLALIGPHGSGKSYLAKSVAALCQVPTHFLDPLEYARLSPKLAKEKMRRVMSEAESHEQALIVVDNLVEHEKSSVEEDPNVSIQNILRNCMDHSSGFTVRILFLSTTASALIPELRRPGRIDKELNLLIPSITDRLKIFRSITNSVGWNLDKNDLEELSRQTPGALPGDILSIVELAKQELDFTEYNINLEKNMDLNEVAMESDLGCRLLHNYSSDQILYLLKSLVYVNIHDDSQSETIYLSSLLPDSSFSLVTSSVNSLVELSAKVAVWVSNYLASCGKLYSKFDWIEKLNNLYGSTTDCNGKLK